MSAVPADFDPNTAENLDDIEKQFAVKAVEHAETYWSLLEKFPPSKLRLTTVDDQLYDGLVELFPEFKEDPERAKHLNEEEIKGKEGKAKWFKFAQKFENIVADYNFGALLRIDSSDGYTESNTMFSFRVQFDAIEIFRNRHGLNDWVYEKNRS